MKELSYITVKNRPVKTVYKVGEQLDLSGLVITAVYSDNSTEEIKYADDNMEVNGFDSSKAVSQQRVTVIYQSEETVFTVEVIQAGEEEKDEKKTSLRNANVSDIESGYLYTGKAVCPVPTVSIGAKILKIGIDYDVLYENNKNEGEATIIIKGKGNYTDKVVEKFRIKPVVSKIKIMKSEFKARVLKKKAQKTKIKICGSDGKVKFKYPKKYISVSKKGIVKLKKHIPRGIYKIKITVAAEMNYKKTVKTIKIIVK